MLATNAARTERMLIELSLEREIAMQTSGRVHDLRVGVGEDGVTIRGTKPA